MNILAVWASTSPGNAALHTLIAARCTGLVTAPFHRKLISVEVWKTKSDSNTDGLLERLREHGEPPD